MRALKKPYVNAGIIVLVTAFYVLVFVLTSGHMEFTRMLSHVQTLQHPLWNSWSAFLRQGYLKYIGYAYIPLAAAILVLSVVRKRDYDEYQTSILMKGLLAAGVVMLLLFPVALLLILSDPNYAIEAVMLLMVLHWSAVLITELLYVIKWGKA